MGSAPPGMPRRSEFVRKVWSRWTSWGTGRGPKSLRIGRSASFMGPQFTDTSWTPSAALAPPCSRGPEFDLLPFSPAPAG